MNWKQKTEISVVILISLFGVVITILDFSGSLDAYPWLSERIPTMILLGVSLIALNLALTPSQSTDELFELYNKSHRELITKLGINQPAILLIEKLIKRWNERETEIERFFNNVDSQSKKNDLDGVKKILDSYQSRFTQGIIDGVKLIFPWDITISAIDMTGKFIYHPRATLISTRPNMKHHREILKNRNGEVFWINQYLTGQLKDIFGNPDEHYKVDRFTKVYFRELKKLDAIVIFESHLDIIYQLPRSISGD